MRSGPVTAGHGDISIRTAARGRSALATAQRAVIRNVRRRQTGYFIRPSPPSARTRAAGKGSSKRNASGNSHEARSGREEVNSRRHRAALELIKLCGTLVGQPDTSAHYGAGFFRCTAIEPSVLHAGSSIHIGQPHPRETGLSCPSSQAQTFKQASECVSARTGLDTRLATVAKRQRVRGRLKI